VSKVIFPEGSRHVIARQILMPAVRELVPLADDSSLAEVEVPRQYVEGVLHDLKLRTSTT